MFTIKTNPKGSKTLDISEANLETIRKYGLFNRLIDSNGRVDEEVLEKLKLNIRSLISAENENLTDLLDLSIEVIYHSHMKAFGLGELIRLYDGWDRKQQQEEFLREDTREE